MKKVLFYFSLCSMLMFFATTVFAAMNDFAGLWKNMDSNTRGITSLSIKVAGPEAKVKAWGKCHPKDCDWGEVKADAYGPTPASNIEMSALALNARYKNGFSTTILVITNAGPNRLKVEAFTNFKDNSGRSNYTTHDTFKRAMIGAVAPIIARPMRPMRPVQSVKEDCISFNPATTRVISAQGRWKIADGNHWMFDFGNQRNEAGQALNVIRHYRMNQSCFVGRPNPSLQYMLTSGRTPAGSLSGEDCISFNPHSIEVKNISGRWKIVDGGHWLFDFKGNEAEARKAFSIIRKHGFNKSCFVGRPHPEFQYMRK